MAHTPEELAHLIGDCTWGEAKLMLAAPALLEALKLAVRYLEHPDVLALPFALSAECAANRARDAIEAAK